MLSDICVVTRRSYRVGNTTALTKGCKYSENVSPQTLLKAKFWGWIFFGFWSQKDKIWGGKREGRGWKGRGKLPELSSWLMKGRGGGRGGQGWVIRGQQEEEEGRADIQLLRRAKANTAVIEMLHFFPLLWVKPFWLQWLAVQIEALPFLSSISGFSGFVYLGILTDSPKVLHWLSGGLSHGRSFKQSSKRQTLEYVYHPSFFSSVHTILSKYVKSWFETKFSACVWYFIYDIWSQNHLLSRSSFFPIPRVQLSWRGAVTILYDCLSVCIGQIDCLKFTPIQNYRHWRAFTVFLRSLLPQGFSYVVWEQSWVGTPRCQCVFEYFKIWSSHKSKTPVQSSLDLSCQAKTSFQSSLVEVCLLRAVAWRVRHIVTILYVGFPNLGSSYQNFLGGAQFETILYASVQCTLYWVPRLG